MAVRICRVDVDEQKKQIVSTGTSMFPITAYYNDLDQMPTKEVPWHWHEELEVIYVVKGSVIIGIQNDEFVLDECEGVFINTNTLHSVKKDSEECIIYSFVFASSLISGSGESIYEQRFVKPLLSCHELPCVKLKKEVPWQREAAACILKAYEEFESDAFGYELLVREQLSHMWYLIVTQALQNQREKAQSETLDIKRMKIMMEYIRAHYQESISLEAIAKAASISEREALRCFQKTIHDTPISYLLKYRISQAASMLVDSDHTITEISAVCGFEDSSYFAKMFKRHIKQSPRMYRKQMQIRR